MLLQKTDAVCTTSKEFQELTFGIRNEDMGLILSILRDKMYSNQIGSICREVASNARDANREVGNEAPIEIGFEDSLWLASDLCITFKDQGPGISPERIADIFINYGASTKRDSNVESGGFGLGAKTPFSYSDNFSIVTIVDGIEYIYTAAIDEGLKGKMYLVSSEKTTKSNGTTIVVPIKNEEDREKFEGEVYRATYLWTVQPKYVNFITGKPQVEILHEHDSCKVLTQDIVDARYNLLIDGIIYNLDSNKVKFASGYYNYNSYGTVFLEFKTGELTISASRESVQYDEKTIELIEKRFEQYLLNIQSTVSSKISSAGSYIEACIQYRSMENDNLLQFVNRHCEDDRLKIDYGNQRISPSFSMRGIQITIVDLERDYAKRPRKTVFDSDFLTLPIYFLDRKLSAPKNRTIAKNGNRFLLIEFEDKQLLKWNELGFKSKKLYVKMMRKAIKSIEWLKECGVTWKSYSSILNTSAPKGEVKPKKRAINIYARIVDHYADLQTANLELTVEGQLTYNGEQLDKTKVAYEPIESLRSNEDSYDTRRLAYMLEKFADIRVFFVTRTKSAHHFIEGGYLTIDEMIQKVPKETFVLASNVYFMEHMMENMTQYENLNFGKSLASSFNLLRELKVKAKDISISRLPKKFLDQYPVSDEIKEVDKKLKAIKERYPLLKTLVNEYSYYSRRNKDWVLQINNYIRLVDEDRSRLLPVVVDQLVQVPKSNNNKEEVQQGGGILGGIIQDERKELILN